MRRFRSFTLSLLFIATAAFCPRLARGDCSLTTTGNVPLPDLGTRSYQGFVGGLYPGGSDVRPPGHDAAGLAASGRVQPLNAAGGVDLAKGRIVFTSIGFSNVTQEWNTDGPASFMPRANLDPSKNPQVVLVDGAEASKDAVSWSNPQDAVYTDFQQKLKAAGVTRYQVQVAWMEQAIAYPSLVGGFPVATQQLQSYMETILRNLKAVCPNLQIVYISSRERAYTDAENALNPEPWAYENGFAVQWTIADQINGAGNLNFDPAKGAVVAPYICWGPYTWADGTNPRSDGFTWLCSDTEQTDYTHPSATGSGKIADHLLAFFKTDPTATPWFLVPDPAQPPQLVASAAPANGSVNTDFQFTSSASDPGDTIVSYLWTFEDGTFSIEQNPVKQFPTAGSYTATLTVTDQTGSYTTQDVPVKVGGGGPTPTPTPTPTPSPTGTPSPTPTPTPISGASALLNISTRGEVGTGDAVLIGGFLINGTGTKKVLLRATGPSLAQAGVTGSLADPTMELHNAAGAIIGKNDNWQTTELGGVITADQVAAIRATTIPPSDARESAIVATLNSGSYTAIVSGVNGASGVGLTEIYDLDATSTASLANISTRGAVQTGDQVLIGGFIVSGPGSAQILVRALGPSLGKLGVSNPLLDPTLELRDPNGNLLQTNDNWADTQKTAIEATNAAPTDPRESAILQYLAPGNYTATVSGKDGGTGIGLVEAYHIP